jgi:hypothetical protein
LQIPDAAGQPVNSGDHQDITGVQEFEHRLESFASLGRSAAALLCSNDLAASSLERGLLDREVLVGRAHPRVTDNSHGLSPVVSFGFMLLCRLKMPKLTY